MEVAEKIAKIWKQNGIEGNWGGGRGRSVVESLIGRALPGLNWPTLHCSFPDVHFVPYDVLLSYPNFSSPNHLSVLSADGQVNFRTDGVSPELMAPNSEDLRSSIQWLAYSAEGTVEGEAVYCHYGREEDFERLSKEFNITSLKGD